MSEKKEIKIKKKDFKSIILILTVPFLLMFLVEHLGEITYQGYGGRLDEATATSVQFITPLGNEFKENLFNTGRVVKYQQQSTGEYVMKEDYISNLHYYYEGLKKDIMVPLTMVIILLLIYLFKKKYSVKLT